KFQRKYGAKGFAVVGVSLDESGWRALKPFLAETEVPYTMLLGDDATAQRYGIKNLPDTFLIDRKGRVAAAYKAGLVDKDDVEANLRVMSPSRASVRLDSRFFPGCQKFVAGPPGGETARVRRFDAEQITELRHSLHAREVPVIPILVRWPVVMLVVV